MKKSPTLAAARASSRSFIFAALVLAASVPAHPQAGGQTNPQPSSASRRRITQEQADTYERWRSNINSNQQVAHEAGKEYLAKYADDEYAAHVRKWVESYERTLRRVRFQQALYKERNYREVYALGRAILAEEPDNLKVIISLAYAGYLASAAGDDSFGSESLEHARRALQSLESGRQPSDWQPFLDRDDALGYLNFIVGELVFKDDRAEALSYYLRSLRHEGSVRRAPVIYSRLAAAYVAAQYEPLAKEYQAKFAGREATPESRAALEKINAVVDRVIDAYARAVALGQADPKYAEARARWLEQLTRFYKFRHRDSTEGLDALIAGVINKPLP